jgi:ribosomal-protein-alanine N-acetyltransferase
MGADVGGGAGERSPGRRRRPEPRRWGAGGDKIGYTIAPSFQRRGYATEAVRALVDYAFDILGADVVRAYASVENAPSLRVAENAGLRLVERFKGRDGDEVWFAVRYELRREDR